MDGLALGAELRAYPPPAPALLDGAALAARALAKELLLTCPPLAGTPAKAQEPRAGLPLAYIGRLTAPATGTGLVGFTGMGTGFLVTTPEPLPYTTGAYTTGA